MKTAILTCSFCLLVLDGLITCRWDNKRLQTIVLYFAAFHP